MPKKETIDKAKKDKAEGKSASTQAGEFIKEQFDNIRAGKHGARSPEQAIAIGLSEARRAGVDLPAPDESKYGEEVAHKAERDLEVGDEPAHKVSSKRSRASTKALQKEGSHAATKTAISRHSKTAAAKRTTEERHESAMKAVETKGPEELSEAGKKAARTRKRNEAKKG
jgi:hypothetical protein